MQDYDNNFANADDFVRCVKAGCEIEFIYDDIIYSVTTPVENILVGESGNEDSVMEFNNPVDAL